MHKNTLEFNRTRYAAVSDCEHLQRRRTTCYDTAILPIQFETTVP